MKGATWTGPTRVAGPGGYQKWQRRADSGPVFATIVTAPSRLFRAWLGGIKLGDFPSVEDAMAAVEDAESEAC